MKKSILFALTLSLTFCTEAPEESNALNNTSTKKADSLIPLSDIQLSQFSKKVFNSGDKRHFVPDSCSFYFECDCCFSDLLFNPDSTFYIHDYCLYEESYSQGRFSISGNTITLIYSGQTTSSTYNEGRMENDTLSPEFFYKDTLCNPTSIKFLANKCGPNLVLTQIGGDEYMTEIIANYNTALETMKKGGFIKKLDSLKQIAGRDLRNQVIE
jgi:hypothetical protein